MTTTLTEYAAQKDAQNTIYLNIVKYGLMLCDALGHDAPDNYFYELDSSGRRVSRWRAIEYFGDAVHFARHQSFGDQFFGDFARASFGDLAAHRKRSQATAFRRHRE